jgi:hypothetical protein
MLLDKTQFSIHYYRVEIYPRNSKPRKGKYLYLCVSQITVVSIYCVRIEHLIIPFFPLIFLNLGPLICLTQISSHFSRCFSFPYSL